MVPCGAEGGAIVFVTLSPVVCCAVADGTLAKSITPNRSARNRNKFADLNFRGKGAIPVFGTVTTPRRHGQDLSFVISLLLLGWARPSVGMVGCGSARWLALCFLLLLQFSLGEKIQHLTRSEISSEHTVLQLQPARPNNPFSLMRIFVRVQFSLATFRGSVALSVQGHSYSAPRIDLRA